MSRTPGSDPDSRLEGDRDRSGAGPVDVARSTVVAFAVALTGFLVSIPVAIGLANVLFALDVLSTNPSGISIALLSLVSLQGIAFPVVAFSYLRLRGLSLSFLRVRTPSLRDLGVVVAGVVAILLLVVTSQIAISALGLTPAQRADSEILTDPDFAVIGIPLMLLIVGPGEELLFRGVVQSTIREVASAPVAIVLANFAFAPAHVVAFLGSDNSLLAILTSISLLFLPGLVFGIIYEYTDNLVVPSLSHGLWNSFLLSLVLFGA